MVPKRFINFLNGGNLRSHLIQGAIGIFTLKAFEAILSFLSSVILARLLGASGLGIFAFASALIQLLLLASTLGFPQLVVREVAANVVQSAWGKIRGLLRWVSLVTFVASIHIALIALFLSWFFVGGKNQDYLHTLWIALLLLPIRVAMTTPASMLKGLRHVIVSQIPLMVAKPLVFFISLLIAFFFLKDRLSPQVAMFIQVIAFGFSLLLVTILSNQLKPDALRCTKPVYEVKKWITSALPLLLIGGIGIIHKQTDIVMLGIFLEARDVGLYRAAQRGAEIVAFSLSGINLALSPSITTLFVKGEIQRLERIINKSIRVIIIYSLPVALLMIFGGEFILSLCFGAEFASAQYALAILSGAQLVNAVAGPVILILNMTGNEKTTLTGVGLSAVLNVILNAALIPVYGIIGAAAASGVCLVILNIFLMMQIKRKVGIQMVLFRRQL